LSMANGDNNSPGLFANRYKLNANSLEAMRVSRMSFLPRTGARASFQSLIFSEARSPDNVLMAVD
jgi:hypothetical protein